MVRLQRYCLVELCERLLRALESPKDVAKVVEGRDKIGIDRQRLLVARQGQLWLRRFVQRHAAIRERLHRAGVDLDGLAQKSVGFGVVRARELNDPKQMKCMKLFLVCGKREPAKRSSFVHAA